MTLGQHMRLSYLTTLPSPHGSTKPTKDDSDCTQFSAISKLKKWFHMFMLPAVSVIPSKWQQHQFNNITTQCNCLSSETVRIKWIWFKELNILFSQVVKSEHITTMTAAYRCKHDAGFSNVERRRYSRRESTSKCTAQRRLPRPDWGLLHLGPFQLPAIQMTRGNSSIDQSRFISGNWGPYNGQTVQKQEEDRTGKYDYTDRPMKNCTIRLLHLAHMQWKTWRGSTIPVDPLRKFM